MAGDQRRRPPDGEIAAEHATDVKHASSTRFGPAKMAPVPQLKHFQSETETVSNGAAYAADDMPV
jgi:hypothetical protein